MAPSTTSNGIPTGTASKRESSIFDSLKAFNLGNLETLKDAITHGMDGEPIDDKTYLMERIIALVAELPPGEQKSDTLTNSFLSQLWNDLSHPPDSYLGYDFTFRKADGSNNNVLWPHIGKAGMPYARSVRPEKMQRPRPDPGVVFDSVLKRQAFVEHPNRISSVLFYVASIIIHDCFHTSHTDYAISETSSYLDLSPLYGSNDEQQKTVRTFKDGKLKPDCFADTRILGFPPGVGVMLIMFNRFHNNVVENLKSIDEGGRFSSLLRPGAGRRSGLTDVKAGRTPEQDFDEALFQTGRLVTTGLYINVILQDYVRTILGLNRVDTLWNLDPRSDYGKALFAKKIPEAQGNQVSAEFSLVYRWHSCVSKRDEAWTDKFLKDNGLLDADPMTVMQAAAKWADNLKKTLPEDRTFDNLKRSADGSYPDDKLAEIWCDSVSDVAGAFGAAHVPTNLKFVEILSMLQARAWNLASLNEFRAYFKLKPHEKFTDINPDPRIADQLEKLYGHPDNVEIYPGIVVESAKESRSPGSGLCASWTTSRAILADAVALVRSDRFHTVDYTPNNLTNWGFNAASYDQNINFGGVLYKLVLNAFPNIVAKNSVYAHFPLCVPDENKKLLLGMKRAQFYSFDRPVAIPAPLDVKASANIASQALTDSSSFISLWPQRSVAFGAPEAVKKNTPTKLSFADAVMSNNKWKSITETFYSTTIQQLWQKKQYELGGWQTIDVVADVMNAAHAAYITTVLGIPASSDNHDEPHGLLCLFGWLHEQAHGSNPQPQGLNTGVREGTHSLIGMIGSFFSGGSDSSSKAGELGKAALAKVQQVNGISTKEAAWKDILPTAALMSTALCRSSARFVRNAIPAPPPPPGAPKASTPTPAPEANKLAGTTIAVRATTSDSDAEKGQKVNVNLSSTNDLSAFGSEVVLTQQVAEIANKVIMEIISKTSGIVKVPGPHGTYQDVLVGGETKYLNEQLSDYVSYPVSMKVRWQVKK